MIIRKKFDTEGPAHIVRNCSTDRCSKSIHGHSYQWEVLLEGNNLDNGAMIIDFGLLKGEIKQFIDLMDHCHMQWEKDTDTSYFEDYSERYIRVPFSPSAENLAIFGFAVVQKILEKTEFNNGEGQVWVNSFICHETTTGYAQAFAHDVLLADMDLSKVFVKHGQEFWSNLLDNEVKYIKEKPVQQVGGL